MNLLLSVGREGAGPWRDLELPADRPMQELIPLLASLVADEDPALEWELLAGPPVRVLEPGRTLAESGIWSGSWLLIRPRSA